MRGLTDVFGTLKTSPLALRRTELGVTGLETAIILIAFVVVASVFAFTVLSTGIFVSERGKETVYAGLQQASGSIEIKGSVIASGVADIAMDDGDDIWDNPGANLTISVETTDKKQGTASTEIDVATAFTTGLIGSEDISPTLDLSSYESISLWIKSGVTTSAGQLELVIDDSTGCASAAENIDLPVLTGDLWKFVTVGITNSTTRSAIACVGLSVAADLSTASSAKINIDEIVARGQMTSIVVLVANSIKGEPIDLTEPSNSDNDGISDSEDRRHNVIISYSDEDQQKNDLYWIMAFVGADDGDDQLETGERVELTIFLKGLNQATPLVKDTQFTLEIMPSESSVLVIQRTAPQEISAVMNLR